MSDFNVKQMLDPVRHAREQGRLQGRLEMRDRLLYEFGLLAAQAEPSVADQLYTYMTVIKRLELS